MRRLALMFAVCAGAAHAQFAAPEAAPVSSATLFTRQCASCHAWEGAVRQGPNLAGVYGRPAGKAEAFKYSAGLAQADWVWDESHLDQYLTNPQAMVTGGVMAYRQANPDTRAQIIAYLKERG